LEFVWDFGFRASDFLALQGLSLSLLMFRISTDDKKPTTSADYFAFCADFFYRCSNFHTLTL